MISETDSDSAEVSPENIDDLDDDSNHPEVDQPVVKVHAVSRSCHPLVRDQGSTTEMAAVNPHGYLKYDRGNSW